MLQPTSKCEGKTLASFRAVGWNDDLLVQHGYAVMVEEKVIVPKETVIRFPLSRFEVIGNEALCGHEVVTSLRSNGVPVIGRMMLQGVSHGTLTYYIDGAHAVYHWRP